MRTLGFIFLSLIVAVLVVVAGYFVPGTYLANFLNEHFIETFAALVGFNIAAVIFLVGQLLVIEEKTGSFFRDTREEIKHNSYFLTSAFIVTLVLLILRPDYVVNTSILLNIWFYLINILVIAIFFLAIFSIYEILYAVFELGKNPLKGSN